MKKIITLIPVCLITGILYAQTIIEKSFEFNQKESVSLNIQIADSIKVIPWDKNEVSLWASVNVNDNKDNDHYKWTFDNSDNAIRISSEMDDYLKNSSNNRNCCCNNIEVYCELHIPANARLSIETINGDLIFTGSPKELHAKTISGFIDLTAPGNLKADMDFKTVTGTIYTNFALNTGTPKRSVTTDFSTSLNGGGNPVNLETISGNIYLRKAK